MKTSLIQPDGIYHDSKAGVRQVVAIDAGAGRRVTYRILAAKVEQEYSYAEKGMVFLIGTTNTCDLESFTRWAKTSIQPAELEALLIDLAAKKLRLAAGEAAFMASVSKEFVDSTFQLQKGASVSFDFRETRSARSIEKKGLATVAMAQTRGAGGAITLTELGVAWIRQHNDVATAAAAAQQ